MSCSPVRIRMRARANAVFPAPRPPDKVTRSPAPARLAADVASLAGAGDLVTLSGGLGAGKTAFARALIRILTGEQDIEVPSPAFTLMQIYEGLNFPILHADFYRIEKPG